MKKRYIIVVGFFTVSLGFSSCENDGFLDPQGTDRINEAITFADSAYTMMFLTDLYEGIGFNMEPKQASGSPVGRGSIFAEVTDEAEGRYPAGGNMDKVISSGSWNGSFFNKMTNDYEYLYGRVRHANIFLNNIEDAPLSTNLKTRTKAEARFLRAYYYHYLLRYFGGVPLLGEEVYDSEDYGDIPGRNTFEECVEYVISELDAVATILPDHNDYLGTLDYGRVTRGAALALKSRILLMAASPLYNGGSNPVNEPNVPGSFATDPEVLKLVAYPNFEASRWQRAMDAAKAVMDLNQYSLVIDNTTQPGYGFYSLFLNRVNPEYIFAMHLAPGKTLEERYLPRSRGGSQYYHYPAQELVDKFPMINGKPITDPTSGYDEGENPYLNRDPRLGYTVMYNTSLWFLQSERGLAPLYTYVGAPQDGIVGVGSNASTQTGYYRRKGMDEQAARQGGSQNLGSLPLIRYAEILLNYAEAANEVGQTQEAMTILKEIRERAGIQPGADNSFGLPTSPTQDAARLLIQNERAIELAFEEHRYWDIRRWKLGGEVLDGKPLTGMQITKVTGGNPGPDTEYTYSRVPLRTRYFKVESYIFPIPLAEVEINPGMLQNPGW